MTATKKTTKTAKSAEAKATETVEAAINAGKEAAETIETTIDTVVKAGTEAVAKSYEKAIAASKSIKGYEDIIAYNQGNMAAMMEVSSIWFKGVQAINKEVTALASTSMEQGVNASKQVLGCKTVEEVIAVQSDLAKANYDKVVVEGRKLSDMGVKLAENTAAPIAVRVNETVANLSKPLAA